jgi:hypothetical protein
MRAMTAPRSPAPVSVAIRVIVAAIDSCSVLAVNFFPSVRVAVTWLASPVGDLATTATAAGAPAALVPPVALPLSGAPWVAMNGFGLIGFPSLMTSKCRCAPVTYPVAPWVPSGVPAPSFCPTLTLDGDAMWAYRVWIPPPLSSTTWLP